MIDEYTTQFNQLFEPALLEEIKDAGRFLEVPQGEDLIRPGQYIQSMPLLLEGSIKILRPDEEGEELLLYYLEKGDTCAMTLTYGLETTKSEIHAVTETAVKLLMIPLTKGEEWAGKYKTWRKFVFSSYHERMLEMLESIDNIAFNNLDDRLQHFLESKIEILNSRHIYLTHKEIAADLHTNRVVVSRLLKKMENDGKIKVHRSFIEVL